MSAMNSAVFPVTAGSVTISLTPFDRGHSLKLIRARGETIRRTVAQLQSVLSLSTALDAGCGVGFLADVLRSSGLDVRGFDERMENVAEARNRFPEIPFGHGDIQDRAIRQLGIFDLVLCFGLLYRLENPMLAIRHLRALAGKGLLLESMCLPGDRPGMMLREGPSFEDQGLTEISLYPSENCLVKMLYRAGFPAVYRMAHMPDHDDFRETPEHVRRRTVLFASESPLTLPGFDVIAEPCDDPDPWAREETGSSVQTWPARIQGFLQKPRRDQYISLAHRARRSFLKLPIPLRLPFGAWWLAENSALDHELIYSGFEAVETRFVEKLLRRGMTALDIGAHHGLYTVLMSKKVGRRGKVISFEPSPRECTRLRQHIRVNFCGNAHVEPCALGEECGEEDLFLVDGRHDWCNSLRPPLVQEPTQTVRVKVRRLDDVLAMRGIAHVDFLKLDVEGAELSVLRGASRLLQGASRPAILAEIQDLRTLSWGYPAREIIRFLLAMKYRWFALAPDSTLRLVSTELEFYDANLVALPEERVDEFQSMLE